MLHHYTKYISEDEVAFASENVVSVASAYDNLQTGCTSNPFGGTSAFDRLQLFPAF
jgi:hypothetical protein